MNESTTVQDVKKTEMDPISYLEKVFISVNNYISKCLRVKLRDDKVFFEKYEGFSYGFKHLEEASSEKYNIIIKDAIEHVLIKRYNFDKVHVVHMVKEDNPYYINRNIHDFHYRSDIYNSTWGQIIISSPLKNLLVKLVKDDKIYIIETNNKFKEFALLNESELILKFHTIINNDKKFKYNKKFKEFDTYYASQMNKLLNRINRDDHTLVCDMLFSLDMYLSRIRTTFFLTKENRYNYVELTSFFNFANLTFEQFRSLDVESLIEKYTSIGDNIFSNALRLNFKFKEISDVAHIRNKQAEVINQIFKNQDIIYETYDHFLKTFNEFFKENYGKLEDLIKKCCTDKDIDFDDIFTILKYKEQTDYIFKYLYKSSTSGRK